MPSTRQPEAPGRHRVLIIDDATIVHKTIKSYLNSEYEVATAISGKVALRFLQTKEVSLILLDYEMPEMDGPTVLAKLRENPDFAKIPVIFLTGINDVEKIKNALALKPQGYLLKPVDRSALITKMHEILG
jgi:CheY-like chemotaxis protein